jgi:signal transduction histidine kinase
MKCAAVARFAEGLFPFSMPVQGKTPQISEAPSKAWREEINVLHEFLADHRTDLIDRCKSKVAQRPSPAAIGEEPEHGVPLFLDQLIKTLRMEQTMEPMQSRKISGPAGGGTPALSEIGVSAAQHGRELLERGFTVDQVVHDYGDLCQAIMEVAFEHTAPIQVDEFQTLNRCLDNAIADAVTEFAYQRDLASADNRVHTFNERLGFLAHELRNLLSTATLVLATIKAGNVGLGGATSAVLDNSLIAMRHLIDRSLADVRATAGLNARHQLISVARLVADIKTATLLEAQERGCELTVSYVDPTLAVDADRDMLLAAVGNLLQNAFKFTKPRTRVALNTYAAADRIRIDIEDCCGGLPPGGAERLFLPFRQFAADKSGLGLGLAICRRSVEANNGVLSVRNLPDVGCVFTIDLPRHSLSIERALGASGANRVVGR